MASLAFEYQRSLHRRSQDALLALTAKVVLEAKSTTRRIMCSSVAVMELPVPRMPDLKWTLIYIATIVFINWTVNGIPSVTILGAVVPPALFVAGLVFILRDYSQREIGQTVIIPTMIAAALSYFSAGGWIALASALAFFISETADQIVFTLTRRPLKDRILLSSAISVPIDSAVFLYLIDLLTPSAFLIGVGAKMTASVFVWFWLNSRESTALAAAE